MEFPYLTGLNKVASLHKEAAPFQVFYENKGDRKLNPQVMLAVGGAYVLQQVIKKIRNSIRHKALIEDLITTDPIIKQAPREVVEEAYATIYRVAPRLALEKQVVRELLQNVVKFGRLDMNTLKMITDTERTIKDISKSDVGSFLPRI